MDKMDFASLSKAEILRKLNSSEEGLSSSETVRRLEIYGQNLLKKNSTSIFKIFAKQFTSSLIYLLVVASGFSFLLKDYSDGILILSILLINALLGFFQEYHSEKAIEKLEKLINHQILVKRDGENTLVEEKLIVPGDIVTVKEGDIVPADIVVLSSDDLSLNESQLSGESVPIEKQDKSVLFAGSVVEKGEGVGIVYATGYKTELGKIASLSENTKKITQYEKSLHQFSSYLMRVTLFTLIIVFVAKLLIVGNFNNIPSLFLFIIALAITVIPEALPVIATVTLSRGALLLAKKHVIVKRLSSLEDLGNINLLCTDKTGTLTQNQMTISDLVSEYKLLFQKFAIATIEFDEKRKRMRNSYDSAFLSYIPEKIQKEAEKYKQIEDLAFDPDAKRRRVVIKDTTDNKHYLVVVGSTHTLLTISTTDKKNGYLKEIQADGLKGIRTLAISYKEINYDEDFDALKHEKDLLFLGFVKLIDPLRPEAARTIELAEKLGIQIKILTGDNKEVAQFVGQEVGLIKKGGKIYTGNDLEVMSEEEFKSAINSSEIFAEITPQQKYDIIKTLKENYVVGYQGDGINDAPSLKLADVGIAVNTATDVAKDSSEIILLRKDLYVIIEGIRYGRAIFVNINKYIKYTMVGNFGNFFALAGLYLISFDLPLLAIQLLLTSLITDLPHIFIYSDNVDLNQLKKPQAFNIRSLMFISIILGTLTTLFEFIFFAFVKSQSPSSAQTSLFLFLTFIQLIVIFSIRNNNYFWRGKRPSFLLALGTLVVFILSIGLTYLPFFAKLFSFTILPIQVFVFVILITGVYFISLDFMKVWYYELLQLKTGASKFI